MVNTEEAARDDVFAHLEELLDRLPAMQKRGARLARARAAREALEVARRLESARKELADLDARMNASAEAAQRARAAGQTAEEVELAERDRLYFATQRGFRVGPVKNGEKALEDALAAGPFDSLDEAREARLDDDTFEQLVTDVAAYQADYAATLAACEAAESGD